jgi:hypothetical protein
MDGYISNLYSQYSEFTKESVVTDSITTMIKLDTKATNVTAESGFGGGISFLLEGLYTGQVASYWDSRSSAHAGLKFKGSHAGSLSELFTAVNTEWSDVTLSYQGNKLFKWSSVDANLDVGSGLIIDRTTGCLTFNSNFLPASPNNLYKYHLGSNVTALMTDGNFAVGGGNLVIYSVDGTISSVGSIYAQTITGSTLVSSDTLITSPKLGVATNQYYSGKQTLYNLFKNYLKINPFQLC